MSIKALLPWLLAALLGSAAGMTWAVAQLKPFLASLAAVAFACLMILAGLLGNRGLWRLESTKISPSAAPIAGLRNATLMAVTYAWGAVGLAGIYTFAGVKWQHGWQYAAGMALIAGIIALYARGLADPDSSLRAPSAQTAMFRVTALHAAAAAAGLCFLFLGGKLKSPRGDWAANIVFLMGGVTIFALSVMAAITQHKLSQRQ